MQQSVDFVETSEFDQTLSERGLAALRTQALERKNYASPPLNLGLLEREVPLPRPVMLQQQLELFFLSLGCACAVAVFLKLFL